MKNIISFEKRLTLNKSLCFETYHDISYFGLAKSSFKLFIDDYYFKLGFCLFGDIFNIFAHWNSKTDHAGFVFNITIFGLSLHLNIYDNRHWDFIEDNWKNTYID